MMNIPWTTLIGMAAAFLAISGTAFGARRWLNKRAVRLQLEGDAAARKRFQQRREWLEVEFFEQASRSGMPRGLVWVDCDFANPVSFARDRKSAALRAFVSITISFRAIEGGPMEEVEAVGNLKIATAVFLFNENKWQTEGRAIFNLNPDETIQRFSHELEMVD